MLVPTLHLTLYQKMWLLLFPFFLFSLILSHPNTCIFSTQTTWFLPVTVVRTSMDQGLQRWEPDERERERGGGQTETLLPYCTTKHTASHVALAHLPFILPSPCKLSQNPKKRNNGLPSCAKTREGEKKKVSSLEPCHFFFFSSRASPAAGILSAQSSHRHLNLPLLHPIPAVALFKSLPPPSPPHF